MPVCYGRGGIEWDGVAKHVPQDEPKELPMGARHGTEIAYRVYGCRCRKCASRLARDAMEVKGHGRA